MCIILKPGSIHFEFKHNTRPPKSDPDQRELIILALPYDSRCERGDTDGFSKYRYVLDCGAKTS
jgi:hypothetical protein